MPACLSCSRETAPSWKFCVRCGTPIVWAEAPRPDPSQRRRGTARPIPGAIRPRSTAASPRAGTVPRPAVLAVAPAAVGIVALLAAAAAALR